MKDNFSPLAKKIDSYRDEMVKTMSQMVGIKAISPRSGGAGEGERADFLQGTLKEWGFKVKRYSYKDTNSTERASLVTKLGNRKNTIWIIAHIDTVSEGDLSLWKTDPFKAEVAGDRIYGRGTNDDGQPVISAMYALRVLKEARANLKYNYGLVLVADEEVGSVYGMQKLMKEKIFSKNDMFLVPDSGEPDGKVVEIGEKGMLWLKVTVIGKQVHASTPAKGVNAFRYLIKFLGEVDLILHERYTVRNNLFHPNYSTFEMTKHEKNVDSINIIPGKEVAYIDCRVLPEYKLDDVLNDVRKVAAGKEFGQVKIEIETANREDPAPITGKNSEIVRLLSKALKELRGIDTELIGIGGGTVAAFARKAGMPAAVWATLQNNAHQPNEFLKISDMVNDAKVFAYICL